MTDKIDALIASVAAEDAVIDSAVIMINGFSGRLAQAVAEALANGATAEELKPLTALKADIDAKKQQLADAVQANTPAANP